LAKTLFESELVLVYFFCFRVPLVVKLTSLTLSLLRKRFVKGFPLLAPIELMLQSRSSC
jgi:hypothetical protein